MLQLIRSSDGIDELSEELIDDGIPRMTDYNPVLGEFSTMRTAYIASGWSKEKLTAFLQSHPGACIFTTVSNDPIPIEGESLEDLAKEQRVIINGKPYVDMFGRYVYVLAQVSWTPQQDIDLRFEGNMYPDHQFPPEILMYKS